MNTATKKSFLIWSAALIYTALILWVAFILIPIVRHLKKIGVYQGTLHFICASFVVGILFWLWVKRKRLTRKRIFLLCFVFALYFTHYYFVQYEIEKIHLVSYSILAILYKKGFSIKTPKNRHFFYAGLLCCLVGTLDEVLQLFIPRRFFQFIDIYLNSVSGVLGLALLAILSNRQKADETLSPT